MRGCDRTQSSPRKGAGAWASGDAVGGAATEGAGEGGGAVGGVVTESKGAGTRVEGVVPETDGDVAVARGGDTVTEGEGVDGGAVGGTVGGVVIGGTDGATETTGLLDRDSAVDPLDPKGCSCIKRAVQRGSPCSTQRWYQWIA